MPVARSLDLAGPEVAAYCRRWKVRELAVFGSALREDFRPDSDVDVLVTSEPDATWGLLEQTTMERGVGDTRRGAVHVEDPLRPPPMVVPSCGDGAHWPRIS